MTETDMAITESFKFTIYGNQENIKGNPIPYFRQTQRSARFNKNATRYHGWKDHVRNAFNASIKDANLNQQILLEVPIKAYLHTEIYFANRKHGDSDNIQKGIKDAIFKNDKMVAGTYDFFYNKERPRVDCTIIFIDSIEPNLRDMERKYYYTRI